ncbi:MAG: DMT family transporter [Syntrophotaleaceae bacterium]
MSRNPLTATIPLAVAACLLWSTAFVGIKVGLHYSGPLAFAGQRFMLSGLLLAPFWWRRRPTLAAVTGQAGLILTVALFQTFLLYGFFYWGMTLVPGALAAMVIGASPLVAAVLAHYCMPGDRLTVIKMISLGLGLAGVTVLSVSRQPWIDPSGWGQLAGIGVLLLANVAGGLGNILVARHRAELDPVFLNSAQIFLGGFWLWLLSLPLEERHLPVMTWPYLAALGWLAFLSAAAFSIWFVLLRRPGVRVSDLNLWKFLIPVCGALFSWLLLPEESPAFWPVIGMICIGAAIVLFNLKEIRRLEARFLHRHK